MWKILLAAIVILLAAGCDSSGLIRVLEPDGAEIEVRQPGKAVAPATLSRGGTGQMVISTGNRQQRTPAMIAADKTWIAWIVGPALILIGVGAFVAKKWFPLVPTTGGTYPIAAGVAVMALAIGLPSLPTWIWIAAAFGVGLWLILPGVVSNFKGAKRQKGTL